MSVKHVHTLKQNAFLCTSTAQSGISYVSREDHLTPQNTECPVDTHLITRWQMMALHARVCGNSLMDVLIL